MNRDEERRLRDIERSLERDDPEFVRRINTASGARSFVAWANGITLGGVLLAALGLLAGSAVGGVGLLLTVVGLALRLAAPVFTNPPLSGDDDAGSGDDAVRT